MYKLSDVVPLALEAGFDALGAAALAPVSAPVREAYEGWLSEGKQAGMSYLERNRQLRYDPALGGAILEGAQSVLVVAASYYPETLQPKGAPRIAKYAYGPDYHAVLRERLESLGRMIGERLGPHRFRAVVDTVPFLERYWAARAGLGFIGRNRCLIIPGKGSFFFLGELLTTLAFETEEQPVVTPGARCGSCRRCFDACPTGALTDAGLDGRSCLSCLTIEQRGEIPEELARLSGDRLFGCDDCQDVCPFNSRPTPSRLFPPRREVLELGREELRQYTRSRHKALTAGSALSRARYDRMRRNARIVLSNPVP